MRPDAGAGGGGGGGGGGLSAYIDAGGQRISSHLQLEPKLVDAGLEPTLAAQNNFIVTHGEVAFSVAFLDLLAAADGLAQLPRAGTGTPEDLYEAVEADDEMGETKWLRGRQHDGTCDGVAGCVVTVRLVEPDKVLREHPVARNEGRPQPREEIAARRRWLGPIGRCIELDPRLSLGHVGLGRRPDALGDAKPARREGCRCQDAL